MIIAFIARVDEDGQSALAKLVHLKHTVVVKLDLLNIGVELYSLQTEADDFFNVCRHILAVGVESAEPRESAAAFGNRCRNESVDA